MRERLAHVRFRGTIRERSVEPFLQLLKAIRERSRFRGVLLDISSGGGEAVASMDFYLAVKRLDQVKPVVASVGSMAASGAYMAALGARRIFAYPESNVGSIGVIFPHIAVQELLRRLGISVEMLHAGRHKDAYQGLRPLSEEERTKLTAIVEQDYNAFVTMVAHERKQPVEKIRELATGEFWTGARAKELGLVDDLGDREVALEALSQMTGIPARRTLELAPPRPFLDRFFSRGFQVMGDRITSSVRNSLEDLVFDSGMYRR